MFPSVKHLTLCTLGAAKQLDQNGQLQSGAKANFIVLTHSPVENIKHTQNISILVKDGQVVDRELVKNDINPTFFKK